MTPKPKSNQKKEKIIQAAINIFSEKGLEKGTISSIAKKADVGKGTVYQYFNSKEEMFGQIIFYFFDDMFNNWQSLIHKPIDPEQKLTLLIDQTVDMSIEIIKNQQAVYFKLLIEIFAYAFKNENRVRLDKITERLYKMVEPILIEGKEKGQFRDIDSAYLSFILFSFLDGFALHFFFQYPHYNSEKLKTIIKSLIFNGIKKEANHA